MSFHTVILVGNLGRDPEMRYSPTGQAVTNFSVAVDASYTGQDGTKVEKTIWVRVSTWGKQAEACNQYLKKGKKVLVEGHLQCDPKTGGPVVYEKREGGYGASFEVRASVVRFLSPRGEGDDISGGAAAANYDEPAVSSSATSTTDDIPF
jgi:single-strand DNA-binding protein